MLTREEILKGRTQGTCYLISKCLEDKNVEQVISDIFVQAEGELAKKLIKIYEKQLMLCLIDNKRFKDTLHDCLETTGEYIKENGLYREFFAFFNFIYASLLIKDVDADVLTAYQDILLQQHNYLGSENKIVYGITSDDKLMEMDEIFPYIDYPVYEFKKKYKREPDMIEDFPIINKMLRKYGYKFDNVNQMSRVVSDEQQIINMINQLSYYIDENTGDIVSAPYFLYNDGLPKIPREWREDSFYISKLKKRSFLLPSTGVTAKFFNAGAISNILFKERYIEDKVVLLFRVQFKNGRYAAGMYDIELDIFYDLWTPLRETNDGPSISLKNIILETYCHLTCDIEIDSKKMSAMKIVESIDKVGDYYMQQPIVAFVVKKSGKDGSGEGTRNFNREEYKIVFKDMNPLLRNLPEGYEASDEAIEKAKKWGIEVPTGKTFVSPFRKKVYKKTEER